MNVFSLGSWPTLRDSLNITAIPAVLLQDTWKRSPLKPQ